ncbi:AMP-binding protein [Gordonia humi]|uniref:Acyl-CoA synthetase (AMP-forming)/AMP-acid ligase II n=1 Tax=Gordonia humi TaxID=686429 RepID=A0A840EM49_9ACTN|nr:AMP-binding protein [Gordonia humi]MBB4133845.1 acyl-CoA synthetase (AMP-forming)/AMP-acid ligase II [Gordonia humi]
MHLTTLAAELGDKPAVIMAETGDALTYADLEAASNRIAHVFADLGLRAGDHIALLMENCLDLFPVVWAAQRSGLYYTPVNWHLTVDEAAYIVDNCEATVLVSTPLLADLAAQCAATSSRTVVELAVGGSLDAAMAAAPATPLDGEVEGYYMLYSSGTTGRPKGIMPALTGERFGTGMTIDHMMGSSFGFGRDSVYLSPGPLYHAAPLGWSMGTIRNGGTVLVMEKFDARAALECIARYEVTATQMVPTMFVRLLKLPAEERAAHRLDSLRTVVHAGARCPVDVKQRMIDWLGPILVEFYSGSEATGFFMVDSPTWLQHPGTVGRAVLGTVHICDDAGDELPNGEIGIVWFGDVKRFEYLGDPTKTAGAWNDRGWNTLGDLGHVDDDGYLYLSDRRTDLIVSGGVNIYPREIEDALILHPAVADVVVAGVADDEFGQSVHAYVQPADPEQRPETLIPVLDSFVRERIARFKVPRGWTVLADVPRLPSGKVPRRMLPDPTR